MTFYHTFCCHGRHCFCMCCAKNCVRVFKILVSCWPDYYYVHTHIRDIIHICDVYINICRERTSHTRKGNTIASQNSQWLYKECRRLLIIKRYRSAILRERRERDVYSWHLSFKQHFFQSLYSAAWSRVFYERFDFNFWYEKPFNWNLRREAERWERKRWEEVASLLLYFTLDLAV